MKVSDQNQPIQLNAYIRQAQQQKQTNDSKAIAGGRSMTTDQVEISDQAKRVQEAVLQAQDGSDIRQDKVQEIKMEVEKGTYKVAGAQVATDMLNETIENNIILQKVNTRV
jgi:negative regulator of flagellin synthesis FlgM